MKKWTGILLALLCSGFAHAADHDGVLFEVTPSKLLPATQVGDSVFWYKANEIECQSDDEETPCVATVDHWDTVCFALGRLDDVCPAMQNLFDVSREQLLNDGAEEDVELVSCSVDAGYPVVTYNLWSFHGGPNVQLKDKFILNCPIFIK